VECGLNGLIFCVTLYYNVSISFAFLSLYVIIELDVTFDKLMGQLQRDVDNTVASFLGRSTVCRLVKTKLKIQFSLN